MPQTEFVMLLQLLLLHLQCRRRAACMLHARPVPVLASQLGLSWSVELVKLSSIFQSRKYSYPILRRLVSFSPNFIVCPIESNESILVTFHRPYACRLLAA